MTDSTIVLDRVAGIELDPTNPPFNNYQAFPQNCYGLKILADLVREAELKVIENHPYAKFIAMWHEEKLPPVVPCAFNWFSITLVNYLRLVALVDLMNKKSWKSDALAQSSNKATIKAHCTDYVREVIPEILTWRNKVSAHFAATDPFKDDSIGTLEQSIMNPVSYKYPYYYVSLLKWSTKGTSSELPTWSLTETYQRLSPRFWPEMSLQEPPNGF